MRVSLALAQVWKPAASGGVLLSPGALVLKAETLGVRSSAGSPHGHGLHNLWRSHFGVDEHPFATY